MRRRLLVILFAAIGGALTGVLGYGFLKALDWVTRTRVDHGWLVYLVPAAGLLVGAAYHYVGGHAKGGTPYVIEQGHVFTHGVPARAAPMIWAGSIVGHVTGASVGREGAALQMAGSLTDTAARVGRLQPDERRTLIAASLAGGWGAIFAVPFTGVAFTLQVTREHRRRAFVPAIAAAWAGQSVVKAFGYDPSTGVHLPAPDWTIGLPFKLVVGGVAFGLVARVFVGLLHVAKRRMARWVRWPPARPIVGGVATIALMAIVGRDYLGLSTPLMSEALAGMHVHWWVPLWKLVFTVLALGTGFVGGEVLPLLVMGSTIGGAVAPGLNAPSTLLAATGSAAAFSSAAGVVLTGVVLTVEQFGWHTLVPALIVGAAARVAAGRPGLYLTHH